ncbi:MAG: 3-oxoacid CoA-transferase subunit B [Rhodospirillales bacterium]|nr:3-oxoacid CoA-transferase subunit B [Rhodospirillales bacterium]
MNALNRDQMAWRVAHDIEEGDCVNLGVGMPLNVLTHAPDDKEIIFHSENGILGMEIQGPDDEPDPNLVNAGKRPVNMLPGGSFFHHADSFVMIRGGHIDVCVLGAYEVSEKGDLANWRLPNSKGAPAVGGAMDLAYGAKRLFVICEHNSKDGSPKIVKECTLPLTGLECVDRIFTDLAIIDVTADGLIVREMVDGMELDELQSRTGAPITLANDWRPLTAPELDTRR